MGCCRAGLELSAFADDHNACYRAWLGKVRKVAEERGVLDIVKAALMQNMSWGEGDGPEYERPSLGSEDTSLQLVPNVEFYYYHTTHRYSHARILGCTCRFGHHRPLYLCCLPYRV